VARGLPAATVIASESEELARGARDWFASSKTLRVYTRRDIAGVELGGALKNVIALVAGLVDGMELGLNARAAVITRGLAEISRLGVVMGANPLTFAGLSGMGDLVLTCTGHLSRNLWAGRELGKGRSLADILGGTPMVVEGVSTTRAAHLLAGQLGVDMPLTAQMYEVLFNGKPAPEVLSSVLRRNLRDEQEFA
jgi:glycerol-3-phosphate dehydrogenase (NAD(P)+)